MENITPTQTPEPGVNIEDQIKQRLTDTATAASSQPQPIAQPKGTAIEDEMRLMETIDSKDNTLEAEIKYYNSKYGSGSGHRGKHLSKCLCNNCRARKVNGWSKQQQAKTKAEQPEQPQEPQPPQRPGMPCCYPGPGLPHRRLAGLSCLQIDLHIQSNCCN